MTINDIKTASGLEGLEELLFITTEKARTGGGGRRKGVGVLIDKELTLEHVETSHTPIGGECGFGCFSCALYTRALHLHRTLALTCWL